MRNGSKQTKYFLFATMFQLIQNLFFHLWRDFIYFTKFLQSRPLQIWCMCESVNDQLLQKNPDMLSLSCTGLIGSVSLCYFKEMLVIYWQDRLWFPANQQLCRRWRGGYLIILFYFPVSYIRKICSSWIWKHLQQKYGIYLQMIIE